MKKLIGIIAAIAASCIMATTLAQPASANSFNPEQQRNIEKIIHKYLVTNPQVLIEASQALQRKALQKSESVAMNAIKANKHQLFNDANSPVAGNPKGSVVLVEFLDYQCGHCKALYKIIDKLIKTNHNLKVIFKDFPIFGATSEYAAKASIAAYKIDPHKYINFHDGLLAATGPLSKSIVNTIAKSSGYSVKLLGDEIAKPAISDQIKANFQLARKLGLQGTPALVIANADLTQFRFFPGAAPLNKIMGMIQAVSK